MKARATVKCDACGALFENQDVSEWRNKPCPKCGHTYPINEQDLTVMNAIEVLRDAGILEVYGSIKDAPYGAKPVSTPAHPED